MTVAAINGVATFSGCSITATGNGDQISATAPGVTSATSALFHVGGSKLVFASSPGNSTGGVTFASQPTVNIQDASGTVDSTSSASVTLSLIPGTGAGSLSCTASTVTANNGVANFSGCKVTVTTDGTFTLKATSTGLTAATSASFTVIGTPSQLVFSSYPSPGTHGTLLAPQPVVYVEDASGTVMMTSSVSVTLTLSGTGTLTCNSTTVTAVNGVASFSGCTISARGNDVLTASASGLTAAVGSRFRES
jgi:trimeric autotransporter adhesin